MKMVIIMRLKGRLEDGLSPNVRGANMGGVPELGRLSDHVPADLWPLPAQDGEDEPGTSLAGTS